MAGLEVSSNSSVVSIDSFDTALCIVPPRHAWPSIDRIRALYDKSFEKWPPHANLVYPFVRPDSLPRAVELIRDDFLDVEEPPDGVFVSLDSAGFFAHRQSNTLFRHDGDPARIARLEELRRRVLTSLGHAGSSDYRMHMTVAQSEDANSDAHHFLLNKIGFMPAVEWDVHQLHILVRERLAADAATGVTSRMRVWGTIQLATGSVDRHELRCSAPDLDPDLDAPIQASKQDQDQEGPRAGSPYYFEDEMELWLPLRPTAAATVGTKPPQQQFAVSSYNVLAEFTWPISQGRYPLVVKNIISPRARADAVVLLEVTDDFLCYLLSDERVRDMYPFSSHGPPNQLDVDPLPSLLNIVVLSRHPFDWEWLPLPRKHKGSVVVRFHDIGKHDGDGGFLPAVLATAHLTCGLTDSAVASKKAELQVLLRYLTSRRYAAHPLVLAGDFNLATSSRSVEAALRKTAISPHTAASVLPALESSIVDSGLADAWAVSRFELGDPSDGERGADDDAVDGEQGATYDPLTNDVAARVVAGGLNTRPQRYDRILVRGTGLFSVARFNKFGFLKETLAGAAPSTEPTFASNHWGVRCVLHLGPADSADAAMSAGVSSLVVPVHLRPAPESLSNPAAVKDCLTARGLLPGSEETESRQSTFNLLRKILLEEEGAESQEKANKAREPGVNHASNPHRWPRASLVVVPVGSYGLGVWSATSDIDCLCIGPFSTGTFFALATQRLRRAAGQGVKILRRVRASSGTMMELQVRGVRVDLQYCSATVVAENWPAVLAAPSTDPVWHLPVQTLSKLKAARDLDYLRRSVPDLPRFRLAHRFISSWARSRGILSAKFGFLSGIQISLLLARVYKLLVIRGPSLSGCDPSSASLPSTNSPSLPDILATFFAHYASFDWVTQIAFDPFFHRQRLSYIRPARDPLAILGYFPPHLNTAQCASVPSVSTIAREFRRADALISGRGDLDGEQEGSGAAATWDRLLHAPAGATDFLRAYDTYIRIDLQYWGLSPSRGAQLAGWLESRCVSLLVDLARRLPHLRPRIWPARFVEPASSHSPSPSPAAEDPDERDYRGCYLVGLAAASLGSGSSSSAAVEEDIVSGMLRMVLTRFEEHLRANEKYFDARTSWIGVGTVERDDMGELVVDHRNWGDYTAGEEEEEEEEDDGEGADGDDSYDTGASAGPEAAGGAAARKAKKKEKKSKKKENAPLPIRTEPGKRFRTAADVMNRVRWDPGLDTTDYVVGYEDRFVGAREKALEAWKSEQTDEEFIPQHRILYFKRRSDGVVMWDRRSRKDDIFGSGT